MLECRRTLGSCLSELSTLSQEPRFLGSIGWCVHSYSMFYDWTDVVRLACLVPRIISSRSHLVWELPALGLSFTDVNIQTDVAENGFLVAFRLSLLQSLNCRSKRSCSLLCAHIIPDLWEKVILQESALFTSAQMPR